MSIQLVIHQIRAGIEVNTIARIIGNTCVFIHSILVPVTPEIPHEKLLHRPVEFTDTDLCSLVGSIDLNTNRMA